MHGRMCGRRLCVASVGIGADMYMDVYFVYGRVDVGVDMHIFLCCKRRRIHGHVYRIFIVDAGVDMCVDVDVDFLLMFF